MSWVAGQAIDRTRTGISARVSDGPGTSTAHGRPHLRDLEPGRPASEPPSDSDGAEDSRLRDRHRWVGRLAGPRPRLPVLADKGPAVLDECGNTRGADLLHRDRVPSGSARTPSCIGNGGCVGNWEISAHGGARATGALQDESSAKCLDPGRLVRSDRFHG
jgi:hypothetical protein